MITPARPPEDNRSRAIQGMMLLLSPVSGLVLSSVVLSVVSPVADGVSSAWSVSDGVSSVW